MMKKKYMVNLNGSIMYEMRKDELVVLYYSIVEQLEQIEHTMDYIVYAIENVRRHDLILSKLSQNYKTKEITNLIVESRKSIHSNMMGLIKIVESLVCLPGARQICAKKLNYWLKPERKNILSRNQGKQILSMRDLDEAKLQDKGIDDALVLFGLDRFYKNAQDAAKELSKLRDQRNNLWAASHGLSEGLYDQIASDMQILFVGLEGAAHVAGMQQQEYLDLCREIKKLLVSASAAVKARATRKENEKLESKDTNETNDIVSSVL